MDEYTIRQNATQTTASKPRTTQARHERLQKRRSIDCSVSVEVGGHEGEEGRPDEGRQSRDGRERAARRGRRRCLRGAVVVAFVGQRCRGRGSGDEGDAGEGLRLHGWGALVTPVVTSLRLSLGSCRLEIGDETIGAGGRFIGGVFFVLIKGVDQRGQLRSNFVAENTTTPKSVYNKPLLFSSRRLGFVLDRRGSARRRRALHGGSIERLDRVFSHELNGEILSLVPLALARCSVAEATTRSSYH
ncbi:hypothetical protein MUK42_33330 [Musa troglodytarum]|uniref:Uncharacterized protein n=1 Tax=Musa troglodytarum TaxID=320322 RepID=A0A9E7FC57_9LILI|nr:hypothetical protein MUK42_33330 [Musa troglodytarum]